MFSNVIVLLSVKTKSGQENITQIMWPSSYIPELRQGPIHQRMELLAKAILGDDMAFDFDMIISKVIFSNVKEKCERKLV